MHEGDWRPDGEEDTQDFGPGLHSQDTFTFQWERGSPTLRVATGHTYMIASTLKVVPGQLHALLVAFQALPVAMRFGSKHAVKDLFLMTFSGGRHPHPELGDVFLCDRAFLETNRDVRGTGF